MTRPTLRASQHLPKPLPKPVNHDTALRILLVDDDPVVSAVLSLLLRKNGYEVLHAADGDIAWQLIQDERVNFVISDWVMPNLTGIDLCRRIPAAGSEHYVYQILCTSKAEKADLIEGMDAGA